MVSIVEAPCLNMSNMLGRSSKGPSLHLSQILELAIMSKVRQISLSDSRIILTSVPYSLDRLRDAHVICLELVKANSDDESSYVQEPRKHLSHRRVLMNRNVVDNHCPESQLARARDT